jgi:type I restriction enzyme S subunit
MHELTHHGGCAANLGINQTDAKNELRLLVPGSTILDWLNQIADPAISQILLNARSALSFAFLRDTHLPRLISGKLRLPQPEADTMESSP